jgi:hypothetical protein
VESTGVCNAVAVVGSEDARIPRLSFSWTNLSRHHCSHAAGAAQEVAEGVWLASRRAPAASPVGLNFRDMKA